MGKDGRTVETIIDGLRLADIPESRAPKSAAERQAAYRVTSKGRETKRRYRRSDKGKAEKRRYCHDNSKYQTNASYLARGFRAIDGEGITLGDGSHIYVMLGQRDSFGDGDYIESRNGLTTVDIFESLLQWQDDCITVVYGGIYDFNMMLSDLSRADLERLYDRRWIIWQGYRIAWRRGKSLYICRVDEDGVRVDNGVTVYDVVSFFQRPFVQACREYLGDAFLEPDTVVDNKARRSVFTLDDMATMRHYNDVELQNLLALMGELRERLNKVGLRPSRWDGPGAVASALLRREGVRDAMAETPRHVARAARFAYAGGRFEPLRFGSVTGPAYEYDINSAYPAAMGSLPNLARGYWSTDRRDKSAPFALYHIHYAGKFSDLPGAMFRRDMNGTVSYPMGVTSWVWSPEYDAIRRYCEAGLGDYRVITRYVFNEDSAEDRPFAFVERLYKKRQALKKAGDGAESALKLALNSLYGKLCQQVGATQHRDGTWRIPPYHQLEWAGYITSYCRAKILDAITSNPEAIIAVETDALFSSEPLSLDCGDSLGQWKEIRFSQLTYVQSGVYFADGQAGIAKTRGVDRGDMTERDVIKLMFSAEPYATVSMTRFIGLGVALQQSMERWQRWEKVEKTLTLHPTGKRVHHPGCSCHMERGRWHLTMCPVLGHSHSAEYAVDWINPSEEMRLLREEETQWE